MKNAIAYFKATALMLNAKKRNDENSEDQFMIELDAIWHKLSRSEMIIVEFILMCITRSALLAGKIKNLVKKLQQSLL